MLSMMYYTAQVLEQVGASPSLANHQNTVASTTLHPIYQFRHSIALIGLLNQCYIDPHKLETTTLRLQRNISTGYLNSYLTTSIRQWGAKQVGVLAEGDKVFPNVVYTVSIHTDVTPIPSDALRGSPARSSTPTSSRPTLAKPRSHQFASESLSRAVLLQICSSKA